MADSEETLCHATSASETVALAWLRQQGLVDEQRDAATVCVPGGVWQLVADLVEGGRLQAEQAARLKQVGSEARIFGPYISERIQGQGAMGEVYKGRDLRDGSDVAIKVMHGGLLDSSQMRQRFLRECSLLRGIDHPAICTTLDWDAKAESPWLVMEFVSGIGLDTWIKQHGALPEGVALRILRQLVDGLVQVQASVGLVHRDIKPGNIIVSPENPARYPARSAAIPAKLIDFGLAKDVDNGMTMAGAMMGTPAFMATEQIENAADVDARADVYALGATLFNLLTGHMPYEGQNAIDVLAMRAKEPLPDPRKLVTSLSDETRRVVMTAMAPKREERFLNHQALLRAIDRALENEAAFQPGTRFLRKPLTTEHFRKRSSQPRKESPRKISKARMKADLEGVTFNQPATEPVVLNDDLLESGVARDKRDYDPHEDSGQRCALVLPDGSDARPAVQRDEGPATAALRRGMLDNEESTHVQRVTRATLRHAKLPPKQQNPHPENPFWRRAMPYELLVACLLLLAAIASQWW